MKLRKVIFVCIVCLLAGTVVFAAGKELVFGFSIAGSVNPFYVGLSKGVRDYAESHNIRVIIRSAELDVSKQMADIEDFLQQKVDAMLVEAVDSKAIKTAMEKINTAKIPVVAVDVTAEGKVGAEVLSNNIKIGNLAGEWVAAKLPQGGSVVVIAGGPVSSNFDRVNGFKEIIKKYPKIKIVAEQVAPNWGMDEGMRIMENILQAQPKIDYVYCANDTIALGAHAAVVTAARKSIGVIGINGADDAITALKLSPQFVVTVAQYPNLMGALSVKRALQLVNGEKVPFHTDVKVELISKDNVAGYATWWGKIDLE